MSEQNTPRTLARELGVSPKSIRAFLRTNYGKLDAFTTRWLLSDDQARAVRTRFSK
jgi:hypothetical protein